jgi:hypothetical protein
MMELSFRTSQELPAAAPTPQGAAHSYSKSSEAEAEPHLPWEFALRHRPRRIEISHRENHFWISMSAKMGLKLQGLVSA